MLAAAQQRAEALGLRAVILASSLNDVEARRSARRWATSPPRSSSWVSRLRRRAC